MDIKEHFQKQSIPYTSVRTHTLTIESFCTDFLLIFVQRNKLEIDFGVTQKIHECFTF